MQIVAHLLKNMSPPRFSTNVLNVFSTGQMQCFLFVNAETFLPLFKTDSCSCSTVANLPLGETIIDSCCMKKVCRVSCRVCHCVNEIRPGPDLQCPVVRTASRSYYVETITLILSVYFRSMFNKHCTGFTILNSIRPCLSF